MVSRTRPNSSHSQPFMLRPCFSYICSSGRRSSRFLLRNLLLEQLVLYHNSVSIVLSSKSLPSSISATTRDNPSLVPLALPSQPKLPHTFNLSANPIGCFASSGSSLTCSFPAPPRPVWKFSPSMLGRSACSGIAISSFLCVALSPGEPMLAAPPRPVEKAPSPWSPAAPLRTISPSTYLPNVRMVGGVEGSGRGRGREVRSIVCADVSSSYVQCVSCAPYLSL